MSFGHHVLDTERWAPVAGYDGRYAVSSTGRVRSYARNPAGELLTLSNHGNGYLHVKLYDGRGRKRSVKVHVLMLETFIGPRPIGQVTRHLDGNKANNVLGNLAYGTYSENNDDQVRHGTHWRSRQDRCGRGHRLVRPNLRNMAGPGRGCKACHRADSTIRAAVKRGQPAPDMQAESDRRYRELMGERS